MSDSITIRGACQVCNGRGCVNIRPGGMLPVYVDCSNCLGRGTVAVRVDARESTAPHIDWSVVIQRAKEANRG